MGDPRKHRRKYERPQHPWKEERIKQETEIAKKYGLVNKREIWKAKSIIDRFRKGARSLMSSTGEGAEKRRKELLSRLNRIGLLDSNSLEDVLRLTTEDLLERRLQTIVYRKGLANTIKQARQFVLHRHVLVGDRIVDVPSYIVEKGMEDSIRLKKDLVVLKHSSSKGSTKEKENG